MVWRTGRIEPLIEALMHNFSGDIERDPFFKAFKMLFLLSHNVRAIIWPNHSGFSPGRDKPLESNYTRTSLHVRNNFNMDSTISQTSDERSPPLLVVWVMVV